MTITLTEAQEAFVTERMKQDGYASPQEMIDAAFRALYGQEPVEDIPLEQLRAMLRQREENLSQGYYKDFANATELITYVKAEKQRRRSASLAAEK